MIDWPLRRRAPLPPAIDHEFLERLAGHVGQETLVELMADGVIEIDDRLAALSAAAGAGARAEAVAVAHELTGLAGHLGLSRLSAAAAEMQREARAEPDASPARLARPVLDAGPGAMAALRAWLQAHAQ